MNTRFSALLIAGLAALTAAGQALAQPRFMDRGFRDFAVQQDRGGRDAGRWQEREAPRAPDQPDRKAGRKPAEEPQRGYGYGYERRYPHPQQDDRPRRQFPQN